ncbi:MAG: hypothetical protein AB8Y83_01040, partial [Coxiella endosymbiont of Haemaphysalis qinghaiensis]
VIVSGEVTHYCSKWQVVRQFVSEIANSHSFVPTSLVRRLQKPDSTMHWLEPKHHRYLKEACRF